MKLKAPRKHTCGTAMLLTRTGWVCPSCLNSRVIPEIDPEAKKDARKHPEWCIDAAVESSGEPSECPECEGDGCVTCFKCDGCGVLECPTCGCEELECEECGGDGILDCEACGGTGEANGGDDK